VLHHLGRRSGHCFSSLLHHSTKGTLGRSTSQHFACRGMLKCNVIRYHMTQIAYYEVVCVCVCIMYVCTYVCVCMYMCMYVCIYICICVCMHVRVCVCVHV